MASIDQRQDQTDDHRPAGTRLAGATGRDSGFTRALDGFRQRLAAFGLGSTMRPILAPVEANAPRGPDPVPVNED